MAAHCRIPVLWKGRPVRGALASVYAGARMVDDGAMTAAQTLLVSGKAQFTAADQGRAITVAGAGAAGADLVTTIAAYISASQVTLAAVAQTTVATAVVSIGRGTVLLTGLRTLEAGGSVVNQVGQPLVSNANGDIDFWTDTPQRVDVVITNNNSTAYWTDDARTPLPFGEKDLFGVDIFGPSSQTVLAPAGQTATLWVSRIIGSDTYPAGLLGTEGFPYKTIAAALANPAFIDAAGRRSGTVVLRAGKLLDISTASAGWATDVASNYEFHVVDDQITLSGHGIHLTSTGGSWAKPNETGPSTCLSSCTIVTSAAFPETPDQMVPVVAWAGSRNEISNITVKMEKVHVVGFQYKDPQLIGGYGARLVNCLTYGGYDGFQLTSYSNDDTEFIQCFAYYPKAYGYHVIQSLTASNNIHFRTCTSFWAGMTLGNAKCMDRTVVDANMAINTNILTSATAAFVSGDVGRPVTIRGAGTAGNDLFTYIAGFTNATTVTLGTTAITGVVNVRADILSGAQFRFEGSTQNEQPNVIDVDGGRCFGVAPVFQLAGCHSFTSRAMQHEMNGVGSDGTNLSSCNVVSGNTALTVDVSTPITAAMVNKRIVLVLDDGTLFATFIAARADATHVTLGAAPGANCTNKQGAVSPVKDRPLFQFLSNPTLGAANSATFNATVEDTFVHQGPNTADWTPGIPSVWYIDRAVRIQARNIQHYMPIGYATVNNPIAALTANSSDCELDLSTVLDTILGRGTRLTDRTKLFSDAGVSNRITYKSSNGGLVTVGRLPTEAAVNVTFNTNGGTYIPDVADGREFRILAGAGVAGMTIGKPTKNGQAMVPADDGTELRLLLGADGAGTVFGYNAVFKKNVNAPAAGQWIGVPFSYIGAADTWRQTAACTPSIA